DFSVRHDRAARIHHRSANRGVDILRTSRCHRQHHPHERNKNAAKHTTCHLVPSLGGKVPTEADKALEKSTVCNRRCQACAAERPYVVYCLLTNGMKLHSCTQR